MYRRLGGPRSRSGRGAEYLAPPSGNFTSINSKLINHTIVKEFSVNFTFIIYVCVNCSYVTYFISSAAQATPGQQLMNIRVNTISLDGSKVDLS